ncbi:MAG: MFS transporter [Candidatus Thorarchaeota archaeon]
MSKRSYLSKEEHAEYLSKYDIQQGKAMLTIILSILIDVFGYSMVLPLLPVIVTQLGSSAIFVGILVSSNAVSALIFGPVWGKLSDKFGRKPILIISQAGTGVSFFILALSPNVYVILFTRVFDGIFGGQIPVIRAYISDITTPSTRAQEMGKLMVGHTLGMILGPIIGGLLGSIDWRYPAFLASGLAILTIILTIKVLIESMPEKRRKDLKIMIENNKVNRLNVEKIFSKEIIIRFIQVFLLFSITVLFNSSAALILFNRYGASTTMIGLLLTIAGFMAMIYGGILMKPIFKKVGEKRVLIFASFLIILNFLIFPYLYELWMIFVLMIPFVFCMVFLPSLIQSNITKAVDQDKQGLVSGISTNIQSIAQIISPLAGTGYIELGGITIGIFFLNSYELIGFTAVILGIGLVIMVVIDVRCHPYLYEYESKKKKSL